MSAKAPAQALHTGNRTSLVSTPVIVTIVKVVVVVVRYFGRSEDSGWRLQYPAADQAVLRSLKSGFWVSKAEEEAEEGRRVKYNVNWQSPRRSIALYDLATRPTASH